MIKDDKSTNEILAGIGVSSEDLPENLVILISYLLTTINCQSNKLDEYRWENGQPQQCHL